MLLEKSVPGVLSSVSGTVLRAEQPWNISQGRVHGRTGNPAATWRNCLVMPRRKLTYRNSYLCGAKVKDDFARLRAVRVERPVRARVCDAS